MIDEEINLINIYEEVLNGSRKAFKRYTWLPANGGYDNFRRCIRYLVNEKLNLHREEYCSVLCREFIVKHKLDGGFKTLFRAIPFEMTEYAFPEWMIEPWELRRSPVGFWNEETSTIAIKWMIEQKLSWGYEDAVKHLKYDVFKEFGLDSMLGIVYGHSVYDAISKTYPENDWEIIKQRTSTELQLKKLANTNPIIIKKRVIFDELDIKNIINSFKKGERQYSIANSYNVDPSTISKIITNHIHKEDKPNE
jgi:hypothetical protein